MSTPDASHRYARMQRRLDALAERAYRQAMYSDDLAYKHLDDRSRHLADMERMTRSIRLAAAWLVRLDQAAEGRAPPERPERGVRSESEQVERLETADPRLPNLPTLPQLDADEPGPPPWGEVAAKRPEGVPSGVDAPCAPTPERTPTVSFADSSPQGGAPTQAQIMRSALAAKRRAAPAPPFRRSG
jgi:hypothetical protein